MRESKVVTTLPELFVNYDITFDRKGNVKPLNNYLYSTPKLKFKLSSTNARIFVEAVDWYIKLRKKKIEEEVPFTEEQIAYINKYPHDGQEVDLGGFHAPHLYIQSYIPFSLNYKKWNKKEIVLKIFLPGDKLAIIPFNNALTLAKFIKKTVDVVM